MKDISAHLQELALEAKANTNFGFFGSKSRYIQTPGYIHAIVLHLHITRPNFQCIQFIFNSKTKKKIGKRH